MRVINTKYFIDKHKPVINAYYSTIITDNLADPSTLRALLECKIYHLPYYFDVSRKTKIALTNTFRITDSNIDLEYHLLHTNSTIEGVSNRQSCPVCHNTKRVIPYGSREMCSDCWVDIFYKAHKLWKAQITWMIPQLHMFTLRENIHESYAPPGYEWLWEMESWKDLIDSNNWTEFEIRLKQLLKVTKQRGMYVAHSPKKTLLATIIGCRHCGQTLSSNNIWTDPAEGWKDGYCSQCRPPRGSWHISKYEPIGFDECASCGKSDGEYAMWGMCIECYHNWQDSYLDPEILFETAKQYGTYALLLIRPQIQWLNYIRDNLPTCFTKKVDSELVPWRPSIKIDIKEIIARHIV